MTFPFTSFLMMFYCAVKRVTLLRFFFFFFFFVCVCVCVCVCVAVVCCLLSVFVLWKGLFGCWC